jgi:hypothetical protein
MKYVCVAYGSWGGQRPSLAPWVTLTGPKEGATDAIESISLLVVLSAHSSPAATSNCAGAPTGPATRRLTSSPARSHDPR